jgi:hypothetical protein
MYMQHGYGIKGLHSTADCGYRRTGGYENSIHKKGDIAAQTREHTVPTAVFE